MLDCMLTQQCFLGDSTKYQYRDSEIRELLSICGIYGSWHYRHPLICPVAQLFCHSYAIRERAQYKKVPESSCMCE